MMTMLVGESSWSYISCFFVTVYAFGLSISTFSPSRLLWFHITLSPSSISAPSMETHQHQSWRLRLSFRNATILVCFVNLITALLLLQGFLSGISNRRLSRNLPDSTQLRHIMESDEMRRAMEPLELIKRVREIEEGAYSEPERVQQKVSKQTAAVDLSKRLKDIRAVNDANSQKALEEWRKRKMERARQRQLEKNGTVVPQA